MIQITTETARKNGILSGITIGELESELESRAKDYDNTNCEAKRFRMDVETINYIRQHVSGMCERERFYHMYMGLRE